MLLAMLVDYDGSPLCKLMPDNEPLMVLRIIIEFPFETLPGLCDDVNRVCERIVAQMLHPGPSGISQELYAPPAPIFPTDLDGQHGSIEAVLHNHLDLHPFPFSPGPIDHIEMLEHLF